MTLIPSFKTASEFKANLKDQSKALNDILRVGTSAGGAKPKAIIAFNENTQEIRSGQVKAPEEFSYWLLKFDGVSYREHDSITDIPMGIGNIEFAYYRMALETGIRVNEYSHRRNPESNGNPAKATLFVNCIVTVVTKKGKSLVYNLRQ
ncbi:MAG: HipA domain-containing protein [Fibrobacter sp.]|nr:HipA domain-containing protein [Fibrobacter sp.]